MIARFILKKKKKNTPKENSGAFQSVVQILILLLNYFILLIFDGLLYCVVIFNFFHCIPLVIITLFMIRLLML